MPSLCSFLLSFVNHENLAQGREPGVRLQRARRCGDTGMRLAFVPDASQFWPKESWDG
jgi:hypothetical protein